MKMRSWALSIGLAGFIGTAALAEIKYKGGDGRSLAEAVVIVGAKGSTDGVRAQGAWLQEHFPGNKPKYKALIHFGDTYFELITFRHKGKEVDIYFDISAFYGKN
jgi:hypothetical protein